MCNEMTRPCGWYSKNEAIGFNDHGGDTNIARGSHQEAKRASKSVGSANSARESNASAAPVFPFAMADQYVYNS